jgi:arylsulfatase A-like enzyme
MSRRYLLFAFGLLLALPVWSAPPNVLLVVVDDLGWKDLGCYGNTHIDTPHFDRFAAEGMRFTQAYSNAPVCSPSRAAYLTGQYPARVQFTGHITAIGRHRHPEKSAIIPPDDRMYIPLETKLIPEVLAPLGYASAHIGKWHVGGEGYWPTDQGFDVNIAGWTHGSPPGYWWPYEDPEKEWNSAIPTLSGGREGEYLTDRLADEAIGFIEAHKDAPFFVHLSHYAVHTPLQAPADLVHKYEARLAEEASGIDPVYAAMVERVDTNFGRILDELNRLELTDNTLVIVYSDNGGLLSSTDNAPLRAGKGHLYEGGIRVPLIMRWPGNIPAGASDLPVSGVDLLPTLCALTGAALGDQVTDGIDLSPALLREETIGRDAVFWYYPHYSPQAKQPGAVVRDGDEKLIAFYDPPRAELYDLRNDPEESRDLAADRPDRVATLQAKLDDWLEEVGAHLHTSNPARDRGTP